MGCVRDSQRWAARFTPTARPTHEGHAGFPSIFFLPVPGPSFSYGRRAPSGHHNLRCVVITAVQASSSWVAQKRPRDPTSPRAPPARGTHMWPHASAIGHVQQLWPPTRQPSALLPCNYKRGLSPVGTAPRKNSRPPASPTSAPPPHAGDPPTHRQTEAGPPRWRRLDFAYASSTATVSSCRRRSPRRRCGPREVVALEPFDGMPLRWWGGLTADCVWFLPTYRPARALHALHHAAVGRRRGRDRAHPPRVRGRQAQLPQHPRRHQGHAQDEPARSAKKEFRLPFASPRVALQIVSSSDS